MRIVKNRERGEDENKDLVVLIAATFIGSIFIVLTIAYGSIWFWAYLAYLMAYGLIYNLVLKRDV